MEALPNAASAPPHRILLLGGLRVELPDARVLQRFQTQKSAALLGYLAYHRTRTFLREELIELLWPEVEPATGRNRFKQVFASLRRQLEPPPLTHGSVLVTVGRTGVKLNAGGVLTDVVDFEEALQSAKRAGDDAAERAHHLARAVDLYSGPLLHGHDDLWIQGERLRLADAYRDALHQTADALREAGDLSSALHYAHLMVQADPYDENARAALMRVYHERGEPDEVWRQFRKIEDLLREDDCEPSENLRVRARQLRRQAARRGAERSASSLQVSERALSTSPEGRRSEARQTGTVVRLPRPLTRFFGREGEVARIAQMLGDKVTRLVTLTGLGGSGKTRLAIEVAGRIAPRFPGGVFFVALTDLLDARLVPGAIADVLRLERTTSDSPLEQIVDTLCSALPTLLVLDNFEQIVDEGAALAGELLARVPTLTCLITSRQRLDLMGEQEFPLFPLPTPDPRKADTPERLMENATVCLFLDRARSIRPDFPLNERNAGAVAALCRRLDGIPLAVELAAAWAQTLSAAQILAQMSLDFLTSRRKDLPARHRTLRQTLAVSYRLLPEDLRRFFTRLSVFRGGWDLSAARSVCDEPRALDFLARLQSHSLLVSEETDENGYPGEAMRHRMYETVREFVEEQWDEEKRERLQQRHMQYYLRLARQAETQLQGPDQAAWLNRLEAEHDNLRAVLQGSGDGEDDTRNRLHLATALHRFWLVRGHIGEGRRWLEKTLEEAGSVESVSRAKALNAAGILAKDQGDYDAARALYAESLALRRDQNDPRGIATCLNNLAIIEGEQGNLKEARAYFEESLSLWQKLGDQKNTARVLGNLGAIAYSQGDYANAQQRFHERLVLARRMGDKKGEASTRHNLGEVAYRRQDYAAAQENYLASILMEQELKDTRQSASSLLSLGLVLAAQGEREHAACLIGVSEAAFESLGTPLSPPERETFDECLAAVRAGLSEERLATLRAEGRAMTIEDAVKRA